MSALKVFTFPVSAQQVRVLGNADKPWFCLTDVCTVLDLSNPSHLAQKQLKQDGLTKSDTIDSMGRTQSLLFVNEANLYRCVMRSNKPEAEAFQDWLVEDVLPSIRKTGSFGAVPNVESEGSEFWRLIDGALKRNLEPKEAIALHQQWSGVASQTPSIPSVTRNKPRLSLGLTSPITDDQALEIIAKICAKKGEWITARGICQHSKALANNGGSKLVRDVLERLMQSKKIESRQQGKTIQYHPA